MRTNMANKAIGVDFGGTKINFVLLNKNKIEKSYRIKTGKIKNKIDIIKKIISGIEKLGGDFEAVGIGMAGMINHYNGEATFLTNLGGISHFFIRDELEKIVKKPVHIENDVNVALFGESRLGAMKGYKHGILIAVGTGIGGAIMLSGKLYTGRDGFAGEFGHITAKGNGLKCGCGKRGCLETTSSGSGIERYVKNRLKARKTCIDKISAERIILCAESGDALALEAVENASYYLARISGDLINVFNPEIVVYGGGVAESTFMYRRVVNKIPQFALPELFKNVIITRGALKNNAGAIGAALLAGAITREEEVYI
jgi:glucokinase